MKRRVNSQIHNVPATQISQLNSTYDRSLYPRLPSDFTFAYKMKLRQLASLDNFYLSRTSIADYLLDRVASRLGIEDVEVILHSLASQEDDSLEASILIVLPETATARDAFHVNRVLSEDSNWSAIDDDWELSVEDGERELSEKSGTETLSEEFGYYNYSTTALKISASLLGICTVFSLFVGMVVGSLIAAKFLVRPKDHDLAIQNHDAQAS